MAELKLPRLLGAAKEFNVGQDTIIDFLIGKGFPKDDLKPTSKITEEMYRSLQQEFAGDKVAKLKSDQIDLPKGSVEAKKKKEEETVVFKKEAKKEEVKKWKTLIHSDKKITFLSIQEFLTLQGIWSGKYGQTRNTLKNGGVQTVFRSQQIPCPLNLEKPGILLCTAWVGTGKTKLSM